MAKTSVLTIMIQLAKQGNADRETIKGLAQLKSNVTQVMGVLGAMAGAATAVGIALGNTVNTVVDYASQVRELSRLTGTSADETSRLIQIADDVTISYESLQKSLWFASKNGVEVNIDSIARLADEYNSLAGPTEQAAFLAEKFGKSGAEMGKLLEQGGAGIRSASAAVSDSMILTDQAVASAREYEIQVDNLTDQWDAFKMKIGQEVIPVLNEMMWGINNQNAVHEEMIRLQREGIAKSREEALAMAVANVKINEQTGGLDSASRSYAAYGEAIKAASSATGQLIVDIDAMNAKNQGQLSLIMDLQSETTNYNQKNDELKAKLAELYAEQDKFIEGGRKYTEMQGEIDATKNAMSQLAAEHEAASKQIAFSLLQQKMAVDGLTDAEFSSLLGIAEKWGIVDSKVAESALIMDAQATAMANSLGAPDSQMADIIDKANNLQRKSGSIFDFYVNIHTSGNFPSIPQRGTNTGAGAGMANNAGVDAEYDLNGFAGGGVINPGAMTIVGEGASGWSDTAEVIVNGVVIPHSVAQWMKNAGMLDGASRAMFGSAMDVQETRAVIAGQVDRRRARRRSRVRTASPVHSGGSGSQTADAAVVETVSAATDVSAAAVQSSVAVQQQATKEAIETRATIAAGNSTIAGKLDELNNNMNVYNATIQRSIVAAVQKANI